MGICHDHKSGLIQKSDKRNVILGHLDGPAAYKNRNTDQNKKQNQKRRNPFDASDYHFLNGILHAGFFTSQEQLLS